MIDIIVLLSYLKVFQQKYSKRFDNLPSLLTLSNIFHKQFFYFASSFSLKTNLIKDNNKCQDNCVSIAKRPLNKFLNNKTVTMSNILTIPIRFIKPFLNEKGYVFFIQFITVILFDSTQE